MSHAGHGSPVASTPHQVCFTKTAIVGRESSTGEYGQRAQRIDEEEASGTAILKKPAGTARLKKPNNVLEKPSGKQILSFACKTKSEPKKTVFARVRSHKWG